MLRWRLVAVCSLIGIMTGVGGALAQSQPSLAEVARQEAERRKSLAKAGKVYTNDDTKTGRPLTTGSSPLARAAEKTQESAEAADKVEGGEAESGGTETGKKATSKADSKADATKADAAKGNRDAVTKRILNTQERISRNDVEAQRAQKLVDDINERVLASFDQVERDQLISQRDAAMAAFRKVQADTAELRQVLRDLEAGAASSTTKGPQ